MTGLPPSVSKRWYKLRQASRAQLEAQGTVCPESGVLGSAGARIALHSDFGPPGQDKPGNQDFGLAWVPYPRQAGGPRWVAALADGVTSSYYAAAAAELVCWTSAAALVANASLDPAERALASILAAGEAIGAVGDVIESDLEAHCPDGGFASIWRYTLREGLYLQTTVMLAWEEAQRIYLATVGDGGAQILRRTACTERSETLAEADLSTHQVHALGPRNQRVSQPDVWRETPVDGQTGFALYTDGVSRGLQLLNRSLFCEGNGAVGTMNPAETLIREWIRTKPLAFDDNLSLVLVFPDPEKEREKQP